MDTFFGLDIGSTALKIVELKKTNNGLYLQAYGKMEMPKGIAISEAQPDIEEIASLIRKLMKESQVTTNKVVVGLPESVVFTRVVEVPVMSDQELKTAMRWEAEQFIPIPLKDVKYDYEILKRPGKESQEVKLNSKKEKMGVFFVAVPNTTIDRYLKITKIASLEPIAMETEVIALVRSLSFEGKASPTTLIINIGADTTAMCIVSKGNIAFTRSVSSGGAALSKAIAQELSFELGQAEEYKKTYGLLENQLEGKLQEIIKPIFDVIVSEIERGILFYQTHQPMDSIKRVILCGGTAKLPGIVAYLAASLDLEVQIGNPWNNVKMGSTKIIDKITEDAPSYAVAVGLSMRSLIDKE